MWKRVKIDDNDYIVKKVSEDGHHKVLLSNFVNIWGEEITSDSLCRRCKCFNPLVEGDEESLVQWTLAQISGGSTATVNMRECEDAQVMEINSKLAGVPFTVKFYLKLMTLEEMYKEITLPLLLMIQQLQSQKYLLFDLLKKKDTEITEYKLEGAKLSRRNIETPTFSESQFEQLCAAVEVPSDCGARPVQLFTAELQSFYVDVMKKYETSKALNEAAQRDTCATDSGMQSAFSDSSAEKKQKHNPKPEENKGDECQKREEQEAQTRLLAKCRKEATKKKKQLNL